MNDILIAIRRNGRCLVLGETFKGKRWIQDNMIVESSTGGVWIAEEGLEEVIALMKAADLNVETIR